MKTPLFLIATVCSLVASAQYRTQDNVDHNVLLKGNLNSSELRTCLSDLCQLARKQGNGFCQYHPEIGAATVNLTNYGAQRASELSCVEAVEVNEDLNLSLPTQPPVRIQPIPQPPVLIQPIPQPPVRIPEDGNQNELAYKILLQNNLTETEVQACTKFICELSQAPENGYCSPLSAIHVITATLSNSAVEKIVHSGCVKSMEPTVLAYANPRVGRQN